MGFHEASRIALALSQGEALFLQLSSRPELPALLINPANPPSTVKNCGVSAACWHSFQARVKARSTSGAA
jgi:hypothetical protein